MSGGKVKGKRLKVKGKVIVQLPEVVCHCEERQRRRNPGFEIASLPSVARNDDETRPRTELLQSKVKVFILILSFTFYLLPFTLTCYAQDVKYPNVAGAFYPQDKRELSQMIDGFLNNANPEPVNADITALISPHAGYTFSGQVAAFGYKLLKNKPYKTVVVIGPSHYYAFSGVSVYPEGVFKTPLGDLEIDSDFAKELLYKDNDIKFDAGAFEKEHSVEVQLPFLQKVLSGFKIVPVVMGDCSFLTCQKLAVFLKQAIGSRKDVLVVASTDMYHGYDYQQAEMVDKKTLSYLKNMDAQGLYYGLRDGKLQLCGGFPVVAALFLSKDMGYSNLEVLKYTTSANVTNKKIKGIWTVGYLSSVISGIVPLEMNNGGESKMLSQAQRQRLIKIARDSIRVYLETGKKLAVSETDPLLQKEMGAFVTLNEHGQLRGCIGNLIGTQPLYLTIRDMAVEAAVKDPRFEPVGQNELKNIEIEISVLSPMEKIDSADKIQLGKHGVLVKKGFRSGVFLPQVATETGWPKEEFLSNLCAHKAGLAADAWKDKSTEIYIFTAEVFSEKDL